MSNIQKLKEMSIDKLLQELRAREAKKISSQPFSAWAEPSTPPLAPIEPSEELQECDDKTIVEVLKEKQKAIYGVDDRIEVCDLPEDSKDYKDADSVVVIFKAWKVIDNGDDTSSLITEEFGRVYNLCVGEQFWHQPTGAFCTGFLVAPDIIATAGHCVDANNLAGIRFIFGFRMNKSGTAGTVINNSEIYYGVELIGNSVGSGSDWALVRIDRPVTDHNIVQIRRDGKVSDNQSLHVIGHPCGLPTKFAGGANVRKNHLNAFFIANLDTYAGSSGSPVFNSDCHLVEGILVGGEKDFVLQGACKVSLICPKDTTNTGCMGEICTRITEFQQLVPQQNIQELPVSEKAN